MHPEELTYLVHKGNGKQNSGKIGTSVPARDRGS